MTRRSIGVVGALGIAGLLLLSVLLLQSLDWAKGSSPGVVAQVLREELEPNFDPSAGDETVQARVIRVGTGRDAERIYEIRLRLSSRVSASERTSAAVLEAAARLASDTLTTVRKTVTLAVIGERTAGPPVRRSWLRSPGRQGPELTEIVEAVQAPPGGAPPEEDPDDADPETPQSDPEAPGASGAEPTPPGEEGQ